MKNLIAFTFALLIAFGISSCKKGSNAPVSITGKWNLVSDSSYTKTVGAAPAGTLYFGVATDYYNFAPNGKLLWRENTVGDDSSLYTINAVSSITINYFPTADPNYINGTFAYDIVTLTAHKMVLTYGPVSYTGQSEAYGRIITFSR